MSPLFLALALFMADAPSAAALDQASVPGATPGEAPWPAGAPREDYQLVAWCYGALRGYLDLHDEVMPEVTRIESSFRRPGSKLADDLKVYADQQREGRADLKRFQSALTAAEKASLKPINTVGAEAIRKGRSVWTAGPDVTKARKAQEWMSWTLPVRCTTTAEALEKRAKLMGATLQVNAEPAPPAPAPTPETPPATPPNPPN